MRDSAPKTIYRTDYQPPAFAISNVDMHVDIYDGYTLVATTLSLTRQGPAAADLILDGEALEIEAIAIDGVGLGEASYRYADNQLSISDVPDKFELTTQVRIYPEKNTSLEGLYRSGVMYCTQCEAQGFRKITFFPDRPDVLATYRVTVEADQAQCPVLLGNGNLVGQERLAEGRHRAVWEDPWPKPCYLFALVAGDLACVEDHFVTGSGRRVDLRIYVEAKDVNYCGHGMESLKQSMRWDESVYGLEYDLDLFNIVAVDDFNFGAMENKSLNIFNTSCVLAAPNITTDASYQRIEAIVAHEYFHNYSGNRVTCRDWFQLSLKEGLTVFREAEFVSDMNSRGVKRVEDAAFLRTYQFAEDAGPMAHPVRPDSFIEISNFYTSTVYEKGAEVVRMLHTLLGHENFMEGASHYFKHYDGQAATCDDFVQSMEVVSGRQLDQFRRWYEQAGTPELSVETVYDAGAQRCSLVVRQCNPPRPGEGDKPPLHIPLAIGLLVDGQPVELGEGGTTCLLEVTEAEQRFDFENIPAAPVASLLRGFSAPVRLISDDSELTLQTLIAGDDDDFVRWDAMQRYAGRVLASIGNGQSPKSGFFGAFERALCADTDPAMKALLLSLPSEAYLADSKQGNRVVDVFEIHNTREQLRVALAERFSAQWESLYEDMVVDEAYAANGDQIGRRALRHLALTYLSSLEGIEERLALPLFSEADNLTDRLAGLRVLVDGNSDALRERALTQFFDDWQSEALAVNQWFRVQAARPMNDVVETVQRLQNHPAFDWRNPNKVRALIGTFANANPIGFHRRDGAGYQLVADAVIRLERDNGQLAAGLCSSLSRYQRYAHGVEQMRGELERIIGVDGLARDVDEIVDRALQEA